jgi:hypothetical protein
MSQKGRTQRTRKLVYSFSLRIASFRVGPTYLAATMMTARRRLARLKRQTIGVAPP